MAERRTASRKQPKAPVPGAGSPASPSRVIFEDDGIRVVHQPADSDIIVIAFNGMGFEGTGHRFFGDGFFAKRDIAAIGIIDTKSSWYANPAVHEAIRAIKTDPVIAGARQRRIAYGASMGAYAALKLGGALNAQAALAFGPQATIDPAKIGQFDRRYQEHFNPVVHAGMAIDADDLCPRNIVFYDPASVRDRRHVAMLPKAPGLLRIASPFIGHPGIAFFTQLNLVEAVLQLVALGERAPQPYRQLVRSGRRASPEYWYHRADYLRRRQRADQPDAALAAYREALRVNFLPQGNPDATKIAVAYADALLDARRRPEAMPVIDELWKIENGGQAVAGLLGLLTKARALGRARALAAKVEPANANEAEPLLERAKLLLVAGDVAGANAAVDAARPLARRDVMAWRHLRWLYNRLGRDAERAEAEAFLASIGALPKGDGKAPPRR